MFIQITGGTKWGIQMNFLKKWLTIIFVLKESIVKGNWAADSMPVGDLRRPIRSSAEHKAKTKCLAALILTLILIQGAFGLSATYSSSGSIGSSSVTLNFQGANNAAINSAVSIKGGVITPSTVIKGPIQKFSQTHQATDTAGKHAEVDVTVQNAPQGITYDSQVLPSEGNLKKTATSVSAEQWLTVPQASYINCAASASYGSTLQADTGIEIKSLTSGDYVTLTGYYNKGYASDNQVTAVQSAIDGSGTSILASNHARDKSGSYSITTPISGSFKDLDSSSSSGPSTQVTQKEHITGSFSSTVKSPSAAPLTRTSNNGNEYDLNMQAVKGSSPKGKVGYYVGPSASVSSGGKLGSMMLMSLISVPPGTIQQAVDGASPLDTINVAAGLYFENVDVDKSLTINGVGPGGDPTINTIVDGQQAGSVFMIDSGADVTLSDMTIRNGKADSGGGIDNLGTLTLNDVIIGGNTATNGGGIENDGIVTIGPESHVINNTATNGAGIYNYANGLVTVLTGSSIENNKATGSGGGVYNGGSGKVTVSGGSITCNTASNGAGVYNYDSGQATINVGSLISNNKATSSGGGIYNGGSGKVTVNGGSITCNTASSGAGVYNSGRLTIYTGGSISNNCAVQGGGIYNTGGLTMYGGCINNNKANTYGGGIYSTSSGCITLGGSTIMGNTANDGGGVYSAGTLNMNPGSSIAGNSAVKGGGIENAGKVYLNTGSSISGNSASTKGGGIYNLGTVNLNGGTISSNRACAITPSGGGIWNQMGTINGIRTLVYLNSPDNIKP